MATKLTKPVSRELPNWNRHGIGLNGRDNKRSLIVTLEPCGVISFRLKGLQSEYTVGIERVFERAMKETTIKLVEANKREKRILKQATGGN